MTLARIGNRWAEDAVLIRQQPGRYERGLWVESEPERIALQAITAPASMATVRDVLPEGTRVQDARTFWVDGVEVAPLRPESGTTADEIEYQGTRYRVQEVQDWRPDAGLEIHAIRVEGQG